VSSDRSFAATILKKAGQRPAGGKKYILTLTGASLFISLKLRAWLSNRRQAPRPCTSPPWAKLHTMKTAEAIRELFEESHVVSGWRK